VIAPAHFPTAPSFPVYAFPAFRSFPAPQAAPDAATGRAATPRTILLVEDEDLLRTIVADALGEEGYTVHQAAHGRAALDLLKRLDPGSIHLILLDMRMPIMDGWDFAAAYRAAAGAHAPIVCMTAAQDAGAWGDQVGAVATLAKPFELVDLLDTVERLIPHS
jgi:two-component system, chemotaxis family, chemotaxis protein CheY